MLKPILHAMVEDMLVQAGQEELTASNFYLYLQWQCERLGYYGAAKMFAGESEDERKHFNILARYFNDRGCTIRIPQVPEQDTVVASLRDAIESAYAVELALEMKYQEWYSFALQRDVTTAQFLLQFVEIQRTSVGEFSDWLVRIDSVGDDKAGLLIIDNEMGKD